MPKAKDARADRAFELYKQGLTLKEIAEQLAVAEGTVRSWKNRYRWEGDGNATLRKKECNVAIENATQPGTASWIEIEHEYVTDISRKPCSLEDLAKKYSIPLQTVMDQSARGKWSEKRREYKENTKRKAIEKTSDIDSDRIAELLQIADMATDKAEQALGELEKYITKDKKKVRQVE